MKRLIGLISFLMLLGFSIQVFAVENTKKNEFDYSNPEFTATVEMLSMEGHGNDDLASCNVKQLYYEEVAEMYFTKGMSKQEILDYYVEEQGVQALKAPPAKGFNLSLWITPFLIILIVAILIFFVVRKWKNNRDTNTQEETFITTDTEQDIYSSMIEEERKKYF